MKQPSVAKETSESPARNSYAVTPHDSNEIGDYVPKALWVGGAGNITLQLVGDTADVVLQNVPAGSLLPIRARIIKATGTTASAMVALY